MNTPPHQTEAAAATWRMLAGLLTGDGHVPPEAALDWEAVVSLAERLQLSPLLYRLLRPERDQVPAALRDRLVKAYWVNLAHNLRSQKRLFRVAQALAGAHIPFVVLKGLSLVETVYPDLGTRVMADIDLLVREEDADRAGTLLQELGYIPETAHHPSHPPLFARRFDGEQAFWQPDRFGCPVELHWDLIDYEWFRAATAIEMEQLWRSVRPLQMAATTVGQLAPADTLLHLCMHLAVHHGYGEMRMLVDLDRLVRRGPELDWPLVVRQTRAFRLCNTVYFALDFARQLLGTPIPGDVLVQLSPSPAVRRLVECLVDPARTSLGRPSLGPQGLRFLHFLLVDRWDERLRGLVRVFFPGRDWIATRYSAERPLRIVLYTAWHPLRMVGLALRALGQLMSRR